MRGFDAAYGIQTGLGQPGRESRNGEALSKFRFKLDIVSRRLWALAAPRKWILLFGLLLMGVCRIVGMAFPCTRKPLIDNVLAFLPPHAERLSPIALIVFAAVIVLAVFSSCLAQILSKAGRRLIAAMRCKAQKPIGSLPGAKFRAMRNSASIKAEPICFAYVLVWIFSLCVLSCILWS